MWIVCEGRSELFVSNEMGLSHSWATVHTFRRENKRDPDIKTTIPRTELCSGGGGGMWGTKTCAVTLILLCYPATDWRRLEIRYYYCFNVCNLTTHLPYQCNLSKCYYTILIKQCTSAISRHWSNVVWYQERVTTYCLTVPAPVLL